MTRWIHSSSFAIAMTLSFVLPGGGVREAIADTLATTSPDDGGEPLTVERVIEIARARALEVLVAATRVAEAQGRLGGARRWLAHNPEIEATAGPRRAAETTTDSEFALAWPVELGYRRGRRVALAAAEVEREEWSARDAERRATAAALGAYYRALRAERGLELADRRRALADTLRLVAAERMRAGDVAAFDVNVAETEFARAESEVFSVQGERARALVDLAAVLVLSSGAKIRLAGDLTDRTRLEALTAGASDATRPDLQAAEAELRAAAADVRLANASRVPEVAFSGSYAREDEGTTIARGGAAVTLPIFDRGQVPRAEARARRARAEAELAARRAAVAAEIEGARAAYAAAVESVRRLEERALPGAEANEMMAAEAYRAGRMGLADFLVLRRDALQTRSDYDDRLLDAALAGVDLAIATGTLP